MSKTIRVLISLTLPLLLTNCSVLQRNADGSKPNRAIVLDTMEIDFSLTPEAPLQIAPKIEIDVLHMELDLSFSWEKEEVYGKALLTIAGFGKARDSVYLDARGFEINQIYLIGADTNLPLEYAYDNSEIGIALAKPITSADTIRLSIDYTARPSLITSSDGVAITNDQGLYFINPQGESGLPQQIWTQGEPESNSAWFPCVDHPHEKLTHEIFITLDTGFHTISNGKLIYSELHNNGTRTDYWKQDLPHANYLVMIAIGEFGLYKDEWNEIPVWYYLDEEYLPYALDIFGNTPEMIEFYSDLLDYPYPWDKYHQVVVKNFVSGAMENTSAVIHGDFVQLTDRELLDESHEDVIAHELFHHWFGDLVTCESWSQLTLNEGFATYGEFLWQDYKYGHEEAKLSFQRDLEAYLRDAEFQPKHLIRKRYNTPDNIFDAHTYQKGGRVLHMLRLEVGDELFFSALRDYLKNHEYGSVELADLRQSFERVTGRDLQWFFDQWFESVGHPQVSATVFDSNGYWFVSLEQKQPTDWPTFRFHLPYASISIDGKVKYSSLLTNQRIDTVTLGKTNDVAGIILDPKGDMLWEIDEEKPAGLWELQLENAESFIARENALVNLWLIDSASVLQWASRLLDDPFWKMRQYGLDLLAQSDSVRPASLATAIELSQLDKKSAVRATAFRTLDVIYPDFESIRSLYLNGLNDRSYEVVSRCLDVLSNQDPCFTVENLGGLVKEKHGQLPSMISKVFARCPKQEYTRSMMELIEHAEGFNIFLIGSDATIFAQQIGNNEVYESIGGALIQASYKTDSWWSRYVTIQYLEAAEIFYTLEIDRLSDNAEVTVSDSEYLNNLEVQRASLAIDLDKLKKIQDASDPPFRH